MYRSVRISLCLGSAAWVIASPVAAPAQNAGRAGFGAVIYGGGVFPLGDFRDSAKTGYHVGAMVDRHLSNSLRVRLDLAFNKFSDVTLSEVPTFREVGTNLLFGVVSAEVFALGGTDTSTPVNAIRPYLLAGAGAYTFRIDHVCRGPACIGPERAGESRTNAGFSIGAGSIVPVSRWMTFFQLAYHVILAKSADDGGKHILLVSAGLRLR
jgi:hypothetical protein